MSTSIQASSKPRRIGSAIARQGLKPLARLLETGDPHATADRLFHSKHVKDLQLILAFALFAVVLVALIGFPLSVENEAVTNWSKVVKHRSAWVFVHIAFAAAGKFLTFFVPVLGVFGALLAWAYQVGSARLGVVDLFACEITTLCRVAAVMDTVHHRVEEFGSGQPTKPVCHDDQGASPHPFTSKESYFPVFDGNSHDLQTLEARVVINITAFYTFMKAVRDTMRTLAAIPPDASAADAWSEAARNVIYLLFLGLESARLATDDLVEFEPEGVERIIVILISELEAYAFLCEQFPNQDDMRHQRIILREPQYRQVVPKCERDVETGLAGEKAQAATEAETARAAGRPAPQPALSEWEPASRLLPELRKRYAAAMASTDDLRPGAPASATAS